MLEQQHRKVARKLRIRIRPAAAPATKTAARVEPAATAAGKPPAQQQQPKPTTMTACASCFRSGVRLAGTPHDDRCRYCGAPKVEARYFTSRSAALRALAKYRARKPARDLTPAEEAAGRAALERNQAAEEPAAAAAVA